MLNLTRTSCGAGRTTRLVLGTLTESSGWGTSSSGRLQTRTMRHTMSLQLTWKIGRGTGVLPGIAHSDLAARGTLSVFTTRISTMVTRGTQCTATMVSPSPPLMWIMTTGMESLQKEVVPDCTRVAGGTVTAMTQT